MAFDRLKKIFGGQRDEGGIPGATVTPTGLEVSSAPAPPAISIEPASPAPSPPSAPIAHATSDSTFTSVSVDSDDLPEGFDLSQIMDMAKQAAQDVEHFQATSQVFDLRDTPEGERLREQLKAAGVDIEAHGQQMNLGGADALAFQKQMFDSLKAQGFDLDAMMDQAEALMGGATTPALIPETGDDAVDDQLAQLQKLGELKAAGVLTDEEFAEQKRKILEG